MRLNYMVQNGCSITIGDIYNACNNFFYENKVLPDTVKMSFRDQSDFLAVMPIQIQTLEKGKDYGLFLTIPGGMVELQVLELENEQTMNMSGNRMIVIECSKVDREFERHVLNKE